MKTFKKLFSVSAIVALLGTLAPMYAFGANYSDELTEAYAYAYTNGITTMDSIDKADMYGNLTRIAMAKMMANYAINTLGLEPDTSLKCSFPDVSDALNAQYDNGVTKACQLGLMGQGIEKFNPNGIVTRAEFGTTLSRALNAGSDELAEMNKANPYYKEHLNFLKDEGIMTKIDTPFSTEVRGYVMLMMMRADEGYTPVEGCTAEELLACLVADDMDACIAECGNGSEEEEDTPVKSGTLKVTVAANNGAKAIIGGTSDLDTINFNASEAGISVEKIVLERYGYSTANGVTVWLEDENGTKVSNEKTINSKDNVSLTIKSNYREMDKTDSFVIVASIAAGTTGGTIGFKVTDVTSSAKTLNLANYTPTTYDMVEYNGATVTYGYKGSNTTYHYTANEIYDVARLKITAGSSAISINGFTLTNGGTLTLNRYVNSSNVKVTVDGNNVPATVSIDKNDKIEISLKNAQSIDAKKNVIFVVSMSLDELDLFGRTVQLTAAATDLRGIEDKTNTRVTFSGDTSTAPTYTFNGGQIKMTSKKLGVVDAAAGSSDVVFAEGTIELNGQVINMGNFTLEASRTGIDSMEILLNGVVIGDATADTTNKTGFQFKGVTLDRDGTLKFRLNMDTEALTGADITITPVFNNLIFSGAKYDESNQPVSGTDVIGSISYSTIKVQSAKGTLSNNISKSVEYLTSQTSKQVVFDGTYTAKKGDLNLNEFAVAEINNSGLKAGDTATFYLSINGREVSTINLFAGNTGDNMTFSNVLVNKGEEVAVKLEAEVYAAKTGDYTYALTLKGEDSDGTPAGEATENTVKMSFVDQGGVTVTVAETDAANTVLLRASNIKLAKFTVAPSKTEGTTLDSFVFDTTSGAALAQTGKVVVKIDGQDVSDNITESAGVYTVSGLTETLDEDGVVVEIFYNAELAATGYAINLTKVNDTTVSKTFNKKIVDALVTVTKQENLGDTTKFTFGVERYDNTIEVSALTLSGSTHTRDVGAVSNGDTYEVENGSTAEFIIGMNYNDGAAVTIDKTTYRDFFKVGSEYLKVFKARD